MKISPKDKKEMSLAPRGLKRTKISISETVDNQIEVVGFENVATQKEIKETFGEEVLRVYAEGFPFYFLDESHQYIYLYATLGPYISIYKNTMFPKNDWNIIVKTMKAAGKRLRQIVKANSERTVSTVII